MERVALRTPFSSPRQYSRLSSDDEADDAEPPAPAQPRLDPETVQKLQRKFLSHVAQARPRQTDAGAVVQLVVGGDAWVIDLRPQVPLARVVQPGRVSTAPDVRLAISPDDLQALLDRRLSPFRAWQSKQLVVSGDLLKLRAMKWLRDGGAADGDAGLSHDGMGVRVVGTSTEGGFGSYVLRVTEGATAWGVSRRWSECKTLVKALIREYGPGTPFDLPLPPLRSSVLGAMRQHATRASELQARSQQLELCLARTLRLLHTSARAGVGPPLLLAFLGAVHDRGPLAEGRERLLSWGPPGLDTPHAGLDTSRAGLNAARAGLDAAHAGQDARAGLNAARAGLDAARAVHDAARAAEEAAEEEEEQTRLGPRTPLKTPARSRLGPGTPLNGGGRPELQMESPKLPRHGATALAAAAAAAAAAAVAAAPGGRELPAEVPLAQLRVHLEAAEAQQRAAALQGKMRCARAWACASLLGLVSLAIWVGLASLSTPLPPPLSSPPPPPPPPLLLGALLLLLQLPALALLALLAPRAAAPRASGLATRLALLWRAFTVVSTFWRIIGHYRVARVRAQLVEAAGGDADDVWTAAHEHTGDLIRDRFGELRGCANT